MEIDFGELGRYEARNVTSGMDVLGVMSDVTRPLMALLNSSLGPPPTVKSITVKMQIERGSTEADIRRLELDGRIYRPGDTVTGKVTVRPFRKPRLQIPVRFVLPSDLPDGTDKLDTRTFTSAIVRSIESRYVLSGSASAEFEVQTEPTETLIRQ